MIPAQPQQQPLRRHPLATATANPNAPPAQPASPPLPRQNAKITPPSPPKVISDKSGKLQFHRVGFLGEGGFARVYEVKDSSNKRFACKVVTKSSLKTKKAKTKLYAEIKIHRSLSHPNIVTFIDCFEDDENVYMTLELCPSGSLMDILRRRKRFTEPEARFFMVQVIGACNYMHGQSVIHRDLKLGNLFLDSHMNIKVGDFGLAALIESPGERKKTICGTPNYIAPEVLFDTASGHSFEVDTWSIGVILYTLVVGRPPFQTKDVKAIYKRIRDNDYTFPSPPPSGPSLASRELIGQILTPDPQMRPALTAVIAHTWFTQGPVPPYMPTSAHDTPPNWGYISRDQSDANLVRLKKNSGLTGDTPSSTLPTTSGDAKVVASTLARQEYEFQKAVQPGSPISTLLSSARQPLMRGVGGSPFAHHTGPRNALAASGSRGAVSTAAAPGGDGLLRKLQAAAKSPLRESTTARRRGLGDILEEDAPVVSAEKRKTKGEMELESQKARIVVQMAPDEGAEGHAKYGAETVKPYVTSGARERENLPPSGSNGASTARKGKGVFKEVPTAATAPNSNDASLPFSAAAHTLSVAFTSFSQGLLQPVQQGEFNLQHERVFIVSWVDYCNKYGMGYALTDGSVGVHFNDSTSLVLSCDKKHFDYIITTAALEGASASAPASTRVSHSVTTYPPGLKSKVYLLKHFERYIMDRLYGEYPYTYEDTERRTGMDWVVKYLRMKHVIVFLMSNGVLQFNFYDHSKVMLSSNGLLITHIDKNYKMTQWTLREVMNCTLIGQGAHGEDIKFVQKLQDKLKYCKEVLTSIAAASGKDKDGGVGTAAPTGKLAPEREPQPERLRKASKASLR